MFSNAISNFCSLSLLLFDQPLPSTSYHRLLNAHHFESKSTAKVLLNQHCRTEEACHHG